MIKKRRSPSYYFDYRILIPILTIIFIIFSSSLSSPSFVLVTLLPAHHSYHSQQLLILIIHSIMCSSSPLSYHPSFPHHPCHHNQSTHPGLMPILNILLIHILPIHHPPNPPSSQSISSQCPITQSPSTNP